MEDAKIVFRNFSGVAGVYNPKGIRNFCVILDNDVASMLAEDGWNIKHLNPKDEGDSPVPYLQVSVVFGKYPPKIYMVSSKGKTLLDEEDIDLLDWVEIETADLIIRPYTWSVNGRKGIKAYLKTLYVTIKENEFENKYKDVPDTGRKINDLPF